MHLITAHENTDFDALAACVAAQKLAPGSRIGLGSRLSRPVREYWSLHKDYFPAEHLNSLDLTHVDRLTLVDVCARPRLAHVEPVLARREAGAAVALSVFDHHPPSERDVIGDVHVVEPVGAVTTVLVERLRAEGVDLDCMEATLLALGVHDDTGSLTLGHTTPRDVRAFGWLLEQGADLPMVERYRHLPLSVAQLRALTSVLESARPERVGGVDVAIAHLELAQSIDGLAEVTAEARRLGGFDALITFTDLVQKGFVQVVARSRSGLVDVGQALKAIGGGGHRGAAAAFVKPAPGDPALTSGALADRVLGALRDNPPRPRVVGEVMSTPVRAVNANTPLVEAATTLDRWGFSGVPVVKDGVLVGVLSTRDVARALEHGRGALPVSSHMSSRPRTTQRDVSLHEVLRRMVEHDVGRLPVLDGDDLLGILTRTDVRRGLYSCPDLEAPSEAPLASELKTPAEER